MKSETFGRYTAIAGKLSPGDSRSAYVTGPTLTGRIAPIASFWQYAEAVTWAREHDLKSRMIHDGLQHAPLAGFELPISIEPVKPWDGLTWEQAAKIKAHEPLNELPECPECGIKHTGNEVCYGGFWPDDDWGPAPGGDS